MISKSVPIWLLRIHPDCWGWSLFGCSEGPDVAGVRRMSALHDWPVVLINVTPLACCFFVVCPCVPVEWASYQPGKKSKGWCADLHADTAALSLSPPPRKVCPTLAIYALRAASVHNSGEFPVPPSGLTALFQDPAWCPDKLPPPLSHAPCPWSTVCWDLCIRARVNHFQSCRAQNIAAECSVVNFKRGCLSADWLKQVFIDSVYPGLGEHQYCLWDIGWPFTYAVLWMT